MGPNQGGTANQFLFALDLDNRSGAFLFYPKGVFRMEMGKIVIIGAGHVGSHCALALMWRRVCAEIVLVDKDAKKAAAQAADIADSQSFFGSGTAVRAGTFADCDDADITVVAIGEPRKPGQTRLDLLDSSVGMLAEMFALMGEHLPGGIVITITNPADIVADFVRRALGYPRERVFGTGTLLDTARARRAIAEHLGVDRGSVSAVSMGEHGNSSMIPFSLVRVGGMPLTGGTDEILSRTREIGNEIINDKGSTEFGIGAALAELADAVLRDRHAVMPVSVLLEGEYGQSGVHCGVPCVIGRRGIEKVCALPLTDSELGQLGESCGVIRQHIRRAEAQLRPETILKGE